MIRLDNKPLVDAVRSHPQKSKIKLAAFADISPITLDRIISGENDLTLTVLDKLAGYLGFDVEVRFMPSSPQNGNPITREKNDESPARV